jgi:hypothetical protein
MMVKGTQKQMVVVKTAGNRYYEEAHFVLRDGQRLTDEAEPTMLAEANRILDECMRKPRRRRMRRVSAFLLGLVLGAMLALAVALPALL